MAVESMIVFDISGLGFGHLAQVGPVINRLSRRHPHARIAIGSHYPQDVIKQFVEITVEYRRPPLEATLIANGPMAIDRAATVEAFARLHENWTNVIENEAARLAELRPALVVANISYTSLAAAERASIPSIAFCSMNWLDVFRAYCMDLPNAFSIIEDIQDAYFSAKCSEHVKLSGLGSR